MGGRTDGCTSLGLTCTAGCLPSLLLGELSPVACCSRNWRATWRACKRDTAGWAGGRVPSSSSLLWARSPSSSPEQRPDTGPAGLVLHGFDSRGAGNAQGGERSLTLLHALSYHTSMTSTSHYRPPLSLPPRAMPLAWATETWGQSYPLPKTPATSSASHQVQHLPASGGFSPRSAPAHVSPGQAQPAPDRRSGRGAGSRLIYSLLAQNQHYISAAADIPCCLKLLCIFNFCHAGAPKSPSHHPDSGQAKCRITP